MLARTAELERQLAVGNWQDTLEQMQEALHDLSESSGKQAAGIDLVGKQLLAVRTALHRRELEFDAKEARIIELQDKLSALGVPASEI